LSKTADIIRKLGLSPTMYDPSQIATQQAKAVYKGGIIKDVELKTGLQRLLELEEKVYGEQMRGISKGSVIQKADIEVTTGFGGPGGAVWQEVGDALTAAGRRGWLEVLYGRKAWSCLNYEANVFALLPKEPWGQTGFRVECGEAGATTASDAKTYRPLGGIKEKGQLPDTIMPTWYEVKCRPKTIWHGFDLSEVAEFISHTDDALDILPELRRALGDAHRHHINEMLTANVTTTAQQNIESIDRVCSSSVEAAGCGDVAAADPDICNIDRSVGTACYNAYVNDNNNVDRNLTLALIDDPLQNVWQAGGQPKVMVTGYDTLMHWSQLLEAERRYMETGRIVSTFGGVQGKGPGVEGGFLVAMYNGIPILPSQDVVIDTISRIYYLDTDYLKIAVAKPTQYFETKLDEGMIYMNLLGMEGGYRTMAELRCYCFRKQAKLRDLQ